MFNFFDKIQENLLKLIYPDVCNGCNKLLVKGETILCTSCLHELPYTFHHETQSNEMDRKFYGIIPFSFCLSMLYFHKSGIVQNLIHNLKYKNKQEIGTFLGALYAEELINFERIKNVTHLIPVPLHKKRLHERGYNQVDTFCESLAVALDIPLEKNVLYRNTYSKSQTKKSKTERAAIKESLFAVRIPYEFSAPHFLLVDDVITSGATIEACAKELLKIPNATVSILTIAYAQS